MAKGKQIKKQTEAVAVVPETKKVVPTPAPAVVAETKKAAQPAAKKVEQPKKVVEEVPKEEVEEEEVDEEESAEDDAEEEAEAEAEAEEATEEAPVVAQTNAGKKRAREEESDEVATQSNKKPAHSKQNVEALVHVANLSNDTDDSDLQTLFATYGTIVQARKPAHKNIGFVQFQTAEEAAKCVAEAQGLVLKGNTISVAPAKATLSNGVWITNIPLGITVETLSGYLTEVGIIESVTLFTDNRLTNTASAGVVFTKPVAKKALEYNGANIEGLACRIRHLNEDDFKVRVGSLTYDITSEILMEYMNEAGKVLNINIPKDDKGRGKGIAYVQFADLLSVKNVLDFNGADINGRPCRIERLNLDDGRRHDAGGRGGRGGFRGRGGRGGFRGGRGRGGYGNREGGAGGAGGAGGEGFRGGRGRGGFRGGRGGRGGRAQE